MQLKTVQQYSREDLERKYLRLWENYHLMQRYNKRFYKGTLQKLNNLIEDIENKKTNPKQFKEV